jgi:hypothetical protein
MSNCYDICFIAFAMDKANKDVYESLLIPYTFFALHHHHNGFVEIIVRNPTQFQQKYKNEINILKKSYSNFLIRKPQNEINRNIPNTYRFFEVPTINAKYTYICDVDIMLLENVLDAYLLRWDHSQLCYCNLVRPSVDRLTGVMLVKTDEYYTENFIQCQKKYHLQNTANNDEVILYNMCKEIHGLPPSDFKWRPIFGIHFSPNRGPTKKVKLKTNKCYYDRFMKIKDEYSGLFSYPIFTNLISQLDQSFVIV